MKTIVYIDGLNLYYRALRKSPHKWLDLLALSQASLPVDCDIVAINYYTARVSDRRTPSSPKDQNTYLAALDTLPTLEIHYGKFQVANKWMFLAQPVEFRPPCHVPPTPTPDFALVVRTEEKCSDVNLGAHLVRDAFTAKFEHAALLTDDTDLTEPLRIVVQEARLPVTLLAPIDKPAGSLTKLATHLRHLRPYLGACQFPNPVFGPKGPIAKPADW
jgi:hypothetical protein